MTQQAQRELTADEISAFHERLCGEMSPADMKGVLHEIRAIAGFGALYQTRLNGIYRDAIIASQVAELRDAAAVWLVKADTPDFAIRCDGQEWLFEATQADQPDRRMQLEYRTLADAYPGIDPPGEDVSYETVRDHMANVPAMLEAAARKKAAKPYPPETALVIYLLGSDYGWFTQQVEDCMDAATAPAHGRFREVLVLWKKQLYRVGVRGGDLAG